MRRYEVVGIGVATDEAMQSIVYPMKLLKIQMLPNLNQIFPSMTQSNGDNQENVGI